MSKKCKWIRAFDNHFNIGCVNETKQRGHGHFKSCKDMHAMWEFIYCPYCGMEIELVYPDAELI